MAGLAHREPHTLIRQEDLAATLPTPLLLITRDQRILAFCPFARFEVVHATSLRSASNWVTRGWKPSERSGVPVLAIGQDLTQGATSPRPHVVPMAPILLYTDVTAVDWHGANRLGVVSAYRLTGDSGDICWLNRLLGHPCCLPRSPIPGLT